MKEEYYNMVLVGAHNVLVAEYEDLKKRYKIAREERDAALTTKNVWQSKYETTLKERKAFQEVADTWHVKYRDTLTEMKTLQDEHDKALEAKRELEITAADAVSALGSWMETVAEAERKLNNTRKTLRRVIVENSNDIAEARGWARYLLRLYMEA